ncbi:MAG TPA: hypothetical protein VGE98_04305 [Thermoanaerobaculia bacterium]
MAAATTSAATAATEKWTFTGPDGGAVLAVAVVQFAPNVVYASNAAGAVFRSLDFAATWRLAGQPPVGPPNAPTNLLLVDSQDADTLYALAPGGRMFGSDDGGLTWTARFVGWFPTAAAVSLTAGNVVFAGGADQPGTSGTVLRSADGGRNWVRIDANQVHTPVVALAVQPDAPAVLYAGGDGGLFKTTDGGAHWFESDAGFGAGGGPRVLVIDPSHPTTLYAAPTRIGSGRNVLKSVDGGATWAAPEDGSTPLLEAVSALEIGPTGTVFAAVGSSLFRSADGGRSWQVERTVPAGHSLTSLSAGHVIGAGDVYAADDAVGVAKSVDDGRGWSEVVEGLGAPAVRVAAHPLQGGLVYGVTGSVIGGGPPELWKSTDAGATWTLKPPASPDFALRSSLVVGPTAALFGKLGPLLERSADDGANWSEVASSATIGGLMIDVAFDAARHRTAYVLDWNPRDVCTDRSGRSFECSGYRVFKSTTDGRSWQPLAILRRSQSSGRLIADPVTSGTLYAIAGDLEKSVDGGATFHRLGGFPGSPIDVAVDPRSPRTLYVATSLPARPLFKSVDGGASWRVSSQGLPRGPAIRLTLSPARPATVYALTDRGIYVSDDGGGSWAPLTNGLRLLVPNDLSLDAADPDRLYAATAGGLFTLVRQR